MAQYEETYPEVPALRSKALYICDNHSTAKEKISCADVVDFELQKYHCKECPYRVARKAALKGEPVFANPASYYYASLSEGWKRPEVLVIDEAHNLVEFVTTFGDEVINVQEDEAPRTNNLTELSVWAQAKYREYKEQAQKHPVPKYLNKAKRFFRLSVLLTDELEKLACTRDRRMMRGRMHEVLVITQLEPKLSVLKAFRGSKTTILMSATLLREDVRIFCGTVPFMYLEAESPIAAERRPIYVSSVPNHANSKTDPKDVAAWILKQWESRGKPNTIVHVTYAFSDKLKSLLPGALYNTKDSKQQTIQQFKDQGGLFIAAGCSEGIDLHGDLCRLNLIPILYRENIGDIGVKKRLAQPGGSRAYDFKTIKTTLQQIGRSTRGPEDESTTVIGDVGFTKLVNRYRGDLSKGILDSIKP